MKLRFLGGAQEVGKSSVHMEAAGLGLVFDSGIKLTEPPSFPLPAERVDGAFLSHAHLDHCGYLPALHRKHRMPVWGTGVTFELAHMIQEDSVKIDELKGHPKKYDEFDIQRLGADEVRVQQGRTYRLGDADFTFIEAGHIPGSSGILVEADGRSVFYSGDTHSTESRLMRRAKYPSHADVVISESTYGNRLHPERAAVEAKFLREVDETLERGGTALVPVFAIGRTQEILLLLKDTDWPVYLDGMAKRASLTILKHPDSVKNAGFLEEAVKNTVWVKDRRQRKRICAEPSIIVTTAGMLEGGPVLDYLSHLHKDANSSIILTGYQVEDTNGHLLVDKGYVIDEDSGKRFDVDMCISQYDFSAHSDRDELIRTINAMTPEEVVLMHGDPESIQSLKEGLGGVNVHAPALGDTLEF